jgi:hypothetical protein
MRLVERGLYDTSRNKKPFDPNEKIYFYLEDSRRLADKADPDLREYECDSGYMVLLIIVKYLIDLFVCLNCINNNSLELCSRQLCLSFKLHICFNRLYVMVLVEYISIAAL